MKKPVLAALGLAGACAACCAIPLVLPWVGGTALVAALSAWGVQAHWAVVATLAGLSVAATVALAWAVRRRRTKACADADSADARASRPACTINERPGCGCAPAAAR